jgi:hypothetical protein
MAHRPGVSGRNARCGELLQCEDAAATVALAAAVPFAGTGLGEQQTLRRGISLATFDELLAVNEQNRDSWRPLVGVFDPRLNMLEPSSSYCILGRNELGEVVSTQAARLYAWRQTNFHDEATSLRLHL